MKYPDLRHKEMFLGIFHLTIKNDKKYTDEKL